MIDDAAMWRVCELAFWARIMRRVYARAFFLSKFCLFRFTAALVLI